jgi:hypothetical protein
MIILKEQCFCPCLICGINIPTWTGKVDLLIASLLFIIYSISTCLAILRKYSRQAALSKNDTPFSINLPTVKNRY